MLMLEDRKLHFMKILQFLFKYFFVFFSVLLPHFCLAQNRSIEIKDSTGLHCYSFFRGEKILIAYDTAYVLNKKVFKLFQDNYTRVKNNNSSVKKLEEVYDSLILAQEGLLEEREQSYQQLKLHFDNLLNSTNTFIDKTNLNVSEIDQSLSSAAIQLNKVNGLIDSSLRKLKVENNKKILFGIGGFTAGVVVTTLVFLIAK